ncbi:MAG: hypothetical protein H0V01_13035 [Bacteroidetes bacterium]|nr:hypothetical protein [Bacteroidota bacterium]HET6244992.1 hypothetical protein [Bacteroidia bacterium]
MSNVSNRINEFRAKIETLISLHGTLLKQNTELKRENSNLLEQKEILKTTINNLEEKIKIIKLAKSLSDTDENSQKAKLKINELVREIDNCIAFLNR